MSSSREASRVLRSALSRRTVLDDFDKSLLDAPMKRCMHEHDMVSAYCSMHPTLYRVHESAERNKGRKFKD